MENQSLNSRIQEIHDRISDQDAAFKHIVEGGEARIVSHWLNDGPNKRKHVMYIDVMDDKGDWNAAASSIASHPKRHKAEDIDRMKATAVAEHAALNATDREEILDAIYSATEPINLRDLQVAAMLPMVTIYRELSKLLTDGLVHDIGGGEYL